MKFIHSKTVYSGKGCTEVNKGIFMCVCAHSVSAAAEESRPFEDARSRPHPAGRGGPWGPGGVSHPADGGVELGPLRARTAGTRRLCGEVRGSLSVTSLTGGLRGASKLKEATQWKERMRKEKSRKEEMRKVLRYKTYSFFKSTEVVLVQQLS